MPGTVKVPGLRKVLPGYVIPPLSLGAIEQLRERLQGFDGDPFNPETVATVIDTAHACLRRNYPQMTREEVGELIDLCNMAEVFAACMDVSGLVRKAEEAAGEGAEPGEPSGS